MTRSLGHKVYETLRSLIIEDKFRPGEPLPESMLTELLGASRTPIREALGRLAHEGLVRQYPGRGSFVAEIAIPDIVELYQVREALEGFAAKLAAESPRRVQILAFVPALEQAPSQIEISDVAPYYGLTQQLDASIIGLAGNSRIESNLQDVWTQLARSRRMAARNPDRLLATVSEHLNIVEAIGVGDAGLAESLTRLHVAASLTNLTVSLSSTSRSTSLPASEMGHK